MRNGQGAGSWEQGAGNREQGTGDRGQGTGDRGQGTGDRMQGGVRRGTTAWNNFLLYYISHENFASVTITLSSFCIIKSSIFTVS